MNKNIKSVIFSFFTTAGMFLDIAGFYKEGYSMTYPFNNNLIIVFFAFVLLFLFYKKTELKKQKWLFSLLSVLFSIFIVIGDSYLELNNWNLVFGNIIIFLLSIFKFIGYFILFKHILFFVYGFLNKSEYLDYKNTNSKTLDKIFNKKPFIYPLIIIILCWLPYIISYYPAILSPDPSFQIMQYHGLRTKYSDYQIMIDEDVTITGHHPVLHTVLLGGSSKIGQSLGSENFGLFIYSIIQITILSCTLAYTIKYMKKIKTPIWIRALTLGIYALVPMFPLYSMSAIKDVIFTAFVILYIIFLYDVIRYYNKEKLNIKYIVYAIFISLLIALFRNNGLYLVFLSFPFLILVNRYNRGKLVFIFISFLLLYMSYDKVLLPYLKITPGSVREMLSIPFQQTARYVCLHEKDITYEERNAIDKVLGYDTLCERYQPEISDPVKNEYNKYASSEDLKEYFRYWLVGLSKHPGTYIEATLNNVYGYFTPNSLKWYIYFKFDKRVVDAGVLENYHYINALKVPRTVLSGYGLAFPHMPIVGLLANVGFSAWMIFYYCMHFISIKKSKYLVILLPALISILVCVASPVNTYFRYTMPYVFSNMLVFCLFISIIRNKEVENK